MTWVTPCGGTTNAFLPFGKVTLHPSLYHCMNPYDSWQMIPWLITFFRHIQIYFFFIMLHFPQNIPFQSSHSRTELNFGWCDCWSSRFSFRVNLRRSIGAWLLPIVRVRRSLWWRPPARETRPFCGNNRSSRLLPLCEGNFLVSTTLSRSL